MSDTFADGATRLAGLVPRLLGWRPDDVWRATPAELAAILTPEADAGAGGPLTRGEFEYLMEQDCDGR